MSDAAGFAVLAFTSLLAIVNPLSAVPIFLGLTGGYDAAHRRTTVARAVVSAMAILFAFTLLGTAILNFFGITTYAFRITGGIIFFGIGWDMLQARRSRAKTTPEEEVESAERTEVGYVPLGIPTLAGPGAITTVVALTGEGAGVLETTIVLAMTAIVLLISGLVLLAAPVLLRTFGQTGLNVFTRVMGLLVMVIGTQFVLDGLGTVVRQLQAG